MASQTSQTVRTFADVRLYPHLWLRRVRVRFYPYKLVTTIRDFTVRPYLHLSQPQHLYITAPTSIILYGETTTDDNNPLLAKMGLEKGGGASGVGYGDVLFF
jgi:hypothetical protein